LTLDNARFRAEYKLWHVRFLVLFFIFLESCQTEKTIDPFIISEFSRVEIDGQPDNPELIVKAGYSNLEISNCLSGYCFRVNYEFNSCGKTSSVIAGWNGNQWNDVYDSSCRLIKTVRGVDLVLDNDESQIDYQWINDSLVIQIISDTSGVNYIDTVVNLAPTFERTSTEEVGDLHYPCGESFYGKHELDYSYDSLGLISEIHIFNEEKEVVLIKEFNYH